MDKIATPWMGIESQWAAVQGAGGLVDVNTVWGAGGLVDVKD